MICNQGKQTTQFNSSSNSNELELTEETKRLRVIDLLRERQEVIRVLE